MKFYTKQHKYYCGIDLHAESMYVCILNQEGEIVVHRKLSTDPGIFLKTVNNYREDLVVAVECMFTWYWLADLCARENIVFILGHALYMKAIHGGKAKNDKIDSHKIAALLRGGMIPVAYVYPQEMRATRDLLRRRMYLTRIRAQLLAHVQNTNYQYNLPDIGKKIAYKANREGVAERFPEEAVQKSVELDLSLLDYFDQLLMKLEHELSLTARRLFGDWDRNEKSGGRFQVFTVLRDNSEPIARKFGKTWDVIPLSAVDRQPSNSLLDP